MFRLFTLYIMLTCFKTGQTETFNFPNKFNDFDIVSATIKSVKSTFGRDCEIDNNTSYLKLVSGPCIQKHYKTITYKTEKLSFHFYESTKKKKYILTSIHILKDSRVTFGKNNMKTGSSHILDIVSEYGQPKEKLYSSTSDSIYIYHSKQNQKEYSFIFDINSKLLTSVKIKHLKE